MRCLNNQGPAKGRTTSKAVMLTTAMFLFSVPAFAETPQPVASELATAKSAPARFNISTGHNPVTADLLKSAKQRIILSQTQTSETTTELGQSATNSPLAQVPLQPSLGNTTPLARAALDHGAALYAVSPLTKAATAATGQPVPTSCPNTYDKLSDGANAVLGAAFDAIGKRDIVSLQAQLPGLQAAFNAIPLKALAPEVCNDHVNIYTTSQFFKLSVLKDAGMATGVPANLPLVKQPDLPFTTLSFAIGWSKYELQDFDGAFLALAKGLIIDPSSSFLASEYIATLMRMNRFTDVVGYTETFLSNNYALDDEERSTFFTAHSVALLNLGYIDAAEKSLMVALYYNSGNKEANELLTAIRTAKAKTGTS